MTKISVKKFLTFLFILIISTVNISFKLPFKYFSEEQKEFREARKHFKNERYNLALPLFLSLQRSYPDNSNFNYCVGMCFYNTSSIYDSCIYYLTRSTKDITLYYKNTFSAEKAPAKSYYYLGIAYLRNNMPETAIRHFRHYQRFLDIEVKRQQFINNDIKSHIKLCENEKEYASQQRQLKITVKDSLNHEIAFYRVNYEGTAQLLEAKTNEMNHLLLELETYNKSQNKPIGTQIETTSDQITSFTIQVLASEQDLPIGNFGNIPNLKKCRMADGLYRYLLGEFSTREEADTRCKEVRKLGYSDAWVRQTFPCK